MEPEREQTTSPARDFRPLVRKVILAGWGCLAASALLLYLSLPFASGRQTENLVIGAICLMLARLAGIGAFVVGGVAIFNRRWFHGLALFSLSVLLPYLAFHFHGTI